MTADTQAIDVTDEEEKRFTDDGREIVPCPHCGADCYWEEAAYGWILVDVGAGNLTMEEAIHYCPKHPDGIEFDDDVEEREYIEAEGK